MHNSPNEQTEPMEGLQPKQKTLPQTPPAAATSHSATAGTHFQAMAVDADESEAQTREDAFTVKFAIGKLNEYLQWFLMVMEALLVIRFLLRMFGANPNNLFAGFVFTLTDILLAPFNGIVPPISLHTNQAFELATLIAMAVYFMLFYALKRFLRILVSTPEENE